MKYKIEIEVLNKDGKPLKAKDLKGQIVAKFPRMAPKLFQKSIRTVCWPFDATITVEFVEENDGGDQPSRPKKQKRKDKRRKN